MIVELQGTHLALTDDRYSFVMDELAPCCQLLKRAGCPPIHVGVSLEKSVEHAPQTRRGRRLYRAAASITTSNGVVRATGDADELRQAVTQMRRRLAVDVRALCESGGRDREPKTQRRSDVRSPVAR